MDDKLKAAFADVFPGMDAGWSDELSPEQVLDRDSFGHLALVEAIEREFELQLEADDPGEMENDGRIRELLLRRGVSA